MDLKELVLLYAHTKAEMDDYKKLCDKHNKEIKKLMSEQNLNKFEADEYTANYQVQKRETMNEDMLLQIAHSYNLNNIIKTKEYIDFDELESAIYKGDISPDILAEMNKAREIKEVEVLKITKAKEKK